MVAVHEAFRRLTIGDPVLLESIANSDGRSLDGRCLDARTEALLTVGALIALDAAPSSYRSAVEAALRTGARLEDLLAVITTVARAVGSARVVSAAPKIALAAGYDVEADLE
jgi:4-carboxymuconolactone decarboxylase